MDVVTPASASGASEGAAVSTQRCDEPGGLPRSTIIGVWAVVVGFALVTLFRSAQVGVGLRDPGGRLVSERFVTSIVLVTAFAIAQALIVTLWQRRSLRALPSTAARVLRGRWPWGRVWPVAMALVAYHLVYICYRNLKSWVAFRPDRDHDLMAVDRAIFGGHTPAVLLHDLFGQHTAALVFSDIYNSFPKLVTLAVAGSLVLVRPVRRAYLFVTAMMWIWILGTATYYLVPSLGPWFTYRQDFAGLSTTAVTRSQLHYVLQRDDLLAHPGSPDAYASISAFASLHCGVTCVVLLMVLRYGHRRLAGVLAVYLAAIMVATIYVGMHFVVDDVAGVLIAVASVHLGRLTVGSSVSATRRPPPPVSDHTGTEPVRSPV